jgi:hypothetical protein
MIPGIDRPYKKGKIILWQNDQNLSLPIILPTKYFA